jgi:hypothetical protein
MLISFSADYCPPVARLSQRGPTFHHAIGRQLPRCARTALVGNPHVHPRSRNRPMNFVGRVWCFVWTDTVAGDVAVGEYSAPLPALVHIYPPPLLSIMITPPSPSCSPFVSTVLTRSYAPTQRLPSAALLLLVELTRSRSTGIGGMRLRSGFVAWRVSFAFLFLSCFFWRDILLLCFLARFGVLLGQHSQGYTNAAAAGCIAPHRRWCTGSIAEVAFSGTRRSRSAGRTWVRWKRCRDIRLSSVYGRPGTRPIGGVLPMLFSVYMLEIVFSGSCRLIPNEMIVLNPLFTRDDHL